MLINLLEKPQTVAELSKKFDLSVWEGKSHIIPSVYQTSDNDVPPEQKSHLNCWGYGADIRYLSHAQNEQPKLIYKPRPGELSLRRSFAPNSEELGKALKILEYNYQDSADESMDYYANYINQLIINDGLEPLDTFSGGEEGYPVALFLTSNLPITFDQGKATEATWYIKDFHFAAARVDENTGNLVWASQITGAHPKTSCNIFDHAETEAHHYQYFGGLFLRPKNLNLG